MKKITKFVSKLPNKGNKFLSEFDIHKSRHRRGHKWQHSMASACQAHIMMCIKHSHYDCWLDDRNMKCSWQHVMTLQASNELDKYWYFPLEMTLTYNESTENNHPAPAMTLTAYNDLAHLHQHAMTLRPWT